MTEPEKTNIRRRLLQARVCSSLFEQSANRQMRKGQCRTESRRVLRNLSYGTVFCAAVPHDLSILRPFGGKKRPFAEKLFTRGKISVILKTIPRIGKRAVSLPLSADGGKVSGLPCGKAPPGSWDGETFSALIFSRKEVIRNGRT